MGFKKIIILSLLLIIFIFGCDSRKEIYPEAKALADKYFTAALNGDMKTASAYYDERFFESKNAEEWTEHVVNIWQQLGVPYEYNLSFSKITVAATGTEVVLSYAVGYMGNQSLGESPGIETLTFLKPTTGGPIKLIGHKFSNNAAQ